MLYFVTALKPEAQAIVEKYRLSKSRCGSFVFFESKDIKVIVSGIGVESSKKATDALIEHFNPGDDDVFINIGICGADKKYNIGELIKIGSIIYNDDLHVLDNAVSTVLTCKDNEISDNIHDIVDMESFGFYKACAKMKNRRIYKVVSDHFEPQKVTKDGAKKLIFDIIDKVVIEEQN